MRKDLHSPGHRAVSNRRGRSALVVSGRVALWGAVLAAATMGVLAFASISGRDPSTARARVEPRWDVAAFAESFVISFLAAGESSVDSLADALGDVPDLTGLESGDWFVSHARASAMERVAGERWRVTVAAELLRRGTEEGYTTVGTRHFDVEVVEVDGVLVAASLPAMVAASSPAISPIDDGWPSGREPVVNDALADTVTRFLSALLTGNGELSRYAAPGSGLRAAPATFDTVSVNRIAVTGDGDQRRCRVWVVGESAGVLMHLVYDLTVARRDGRWEVAAIGSQPTASDGAVSSSTEGSW